MNADQPARPDLELRMGETRLPFKNVVITRGFHGLQLSGEDDGGVFKVIVKFHDGGQTREVAVETLSIDSKPPHVVIPGLRFLREWTGGTAALLAIPYGKTSCRLVRYRTHPLYMTSLVFGSRLPIICFAYRMCPHGNY
jgi:hypothetical protein